MMKKVTKKQAAALLKIAKEASYTIERRGDLEERGWDGEDFLEVPVKSIEWMLEQAYLLGKGQK